MKTRALVAAAALLAAMPAFAHTRLTQSTPANASVVTSQPEKLVLAFNGTSRLTALTLQGADGTAQDLGPLPAQSAREFSVPLPRLVPGEYVVNWRIAGADGHVMAGKIAFTLKL